MKRVAMSLGQYIDFGIPVTNQVWLAPETMSKSDVKTLSQEIRELIKKIGVYIFNV
jgi:hypothetical protein